MLSRTANLQRLLVFSIMLICLWLVFCNMFSLFNLKLEKGWDAWTFDFTISYVELLMLLSLWENISSGHEHDGVLVMIELQVSKLLSSSSSSTNQPALTGSDFEIVNSIVWRLSLIFTQAVLNRIPPKGLTRTHQSAPTIQWVAGDHPTTVDRFGANIKRNPQGVTEVTCCQGCLMLTLAGFPFYHWESQLWILSRMFSADC